MVSLEDSAAKLRDAFDKCANKAEKVVEIQRLKIAIARLRSALKKEFCKLGEYLYNKSKGVSQLDISKELIANIDQIKKEIFELECEIKKIKSCN